MATAVKILESKPDVTPRKIEFKTYLVNHTVQKATTVPSDYAHIELICRDYLHNFNANNSTPQLKYDLMFAYKEDRQKGILFLGKFNDGAV